YTALIILIAKKYKALVPNAMINAEKLFLKYITQLSIIIRLHVSKQCLYILDRHDKVTLQYIP
ncbi:hypothetical protein, partial [Priestia megaterium]|uniref:hypothetical protein n=1 Tax=Priestia megaterium TaxID=1404 RepID=UPI00300024CB